MKSSVEIVETLLNTGFKVPECSSAIRHVCTQLLRDLRDDERDQECLRERLKLLKPI